MINASFAYFNTAAVAVSEILILGACGFVLLRRKVIGRQGLDALSALVVNVALPVFIWTRIVSKFDYLVYRQWYVFPVLSLIITLCGLGLGYAFLWLCRGRVKERDGVLSLCAFQNSGYLVIPLIVSLLPPARADKLLVYLFLFLIGFNALIWSLGVFLLSDRTKGFSLKRLFNPVVVAILLGFVLGRLGIGGLVPGPIMRPLVSVGQCAVPLAMLVLGGTLASVDYSRGGTNLRALAGVVLVKLLLLPLLGLLFVRVFRPEPLLGLLVVIQSAMPSAVSLPLIARNYNVGNADFVSRGVFWTHLLSILTIPVFLSLFYVINP